MDGSGGRDHSVGTKNNLITRSNARCANGEMQAIRRATDAQNVPRADKPSKVLFEIREILLENECTPAADVAYHRQELGFAGTEQEAIIKKRYA
jgi:hypothetical protein